MSVKEITTYHTYQNGRPVLNGLNDPALGVIDRRATCATCKNTYTGSGGGQNDCPGHFGHLQVSNIYTYLYLFDKVYINLSINVLFL